jgi:signal transduction histidine kinase/DNA-binding response OmpR family regulator/ligand-binding sensor domain-containing protein
LKLPGDKSLKRKRKRIMFFFLFLLWGISSSFLRANANGGSKYLKNYTPREYDHHPQNWSVIQDKRGIIYAGNQAGLLEFDGVSWRIIDVPNWTVRSLDIDDTGTIYTGGKDEIGFLASSANGTLEYVSLLDKLEDNQKNFSEVRGTHATKEGIYFISSRFLFRWNPKKKEMRVWEANNSFKNSFYCGERLLLQQENVGLLQMSKDSLQLVPGGEAFAGDEIFTILVYRDRDLLIGTRAKGFHIYNGNGVKPFPTEVDNYIKEKYLSHGIRLFNGNFALATLRGGIVVIDNRGKPEHIFNKASGLQDDDVKFVFQDSNQNLWLALNKGISKIEYASPFSIYDDRANLTGIVLSVVKYRSSLYVGTTDGLFCCLSSLDGRFYPVPGITRMCWHLIVVDNSVLAASDQGVSQVREDILLRIFQDPAYVLYRSRTDLNHLWIGTKKGLASLYLDPKKSRWTVEYKYDNILPPIRSLLEDKNGNLWLGTLTKGTIKVDFPGDIHYPVVTRYDTSHGLPPKEIHVFWAAGHVMFATGKGLFRFNDANKIFVPDNTLGNKFADGSRNVFRAAEDKNKTIWFHSQGMNFQAVPAAPNAPGKNGAMVIHSKPFLRIPIDQVNALYPDPDGDNIWFAANSGLVRFDKTVKKEYTRDFSTLIRRVQLINGKSLVFNGYQTGPALKMTFPYKDRNLRFQFAAPFFENESSTTYQVFLEGYDNGWSDFSRETQKDYTNLHPGFYAFRVRAKNVYENVSREAVFPFQVLPPWYLTWWAFLIYTFSFFLVIYFIVKWRSGKLEQEKQRLQQIVEERTSEIENKNRQLEDQSEKLKEMDRIKSRFFANISHEFRTPLTLIMGPLEQILAGYHDNELEKKVTLALRNSQRLLELINQLLDLSKLESGKMKLKASRQNIIPFIKGIAAAFDSLAIQKKLTLKFQADEGETVLYIDPEKLEKILCNLISNAAKFTPAGGEIIVSVSAARHFAETGDSRQEYLEISVRDTGIGIPAHHLPHIFERFYQVESSFTPGHKQGGTGIGLALARELVTLHHGHIDVKSSEGKNSGTEFIIRLPMGKEHLSPDEISPELEMESDSLNFPGKCPGIPPFPMVGKEADKVETQVIAGAFAEIEEMETGHGDGEKNLVLVVDDNADIREYIREALEPYYSVEEAVDGREGIDKARKIIPDLIISDVMMPGADGYQLCGAVKKDIRTSHIPVILLTAKASEENVIQGLETGADDYITKPFNMKILSIRVKNLVHLRRLLQQKIQRQLMMQPAEIAVSSLDQSFLKELQELIEKNLSDPDFNVEQLAGKLYMSQSTLLRKVRALTGDSPTEFIRSYRLQRALQLLKADFGNVTEVAFEVGFSNTAYFTKCFKEKFQQTPSSFLLNPDHRTIG